MYIYDVSDAKNPFTLHIKKKTFYMKFNSKHIVLVKSNVVLETI